MVEWLQVTKLKTNPKLCRDAPPNRIPFWPKMEFEIGWDRFSKILNSDSKSVNWIPTLFVFYEVPLKGKERSRRGEFLICIFVADDIVTGAITGATDRVQMRSGSSQDVFLLRVLITVRTRKKIWSCRTIYIMYYQSFKSFGPLK